MEPTDTGGSWTSLIVTLVFFLFYILFSGKKKGKKGAHPLPPLKNLEKQTPHTPVFKKLSVMQIKEKERIEPSLREVKKVMQEKPLPKKRAFSLRKAMIFSEVLRRPYK